MYIQDAIDAYFESYRRTNTDQTPCQGFVELIDGALEQSLVDLLTDDRADLIHDICYAMGRDARLDPDRPVPTVDEAHLWLSMNKDELIDLIIQVIKARRAS